MGIEMLVERMLERARRIVGNDGLGAFLGDGLADVVSIVGGVSDDHRCGGALKEANSLRRIALLASGEDETHRTSQTARSQVDLCTQAAARASDSLILSPPLAPAAC